MAQRTGIRIVLTGPESTGKTVLATELATHYGAPWVPEFVRTFAEEKGAHIAFSDHGPIARGQMALEDAAIAHAPALLFHDTDLISTVVYCLHYFGRAPQWIEDEARARRATHYLLCDIDLPWVADGVRDRPHQREELLALFRETLERLEAPWSPVSGVGTARLASAIAVVERVRGDAAASAHERRAGDDGSSSLGP
ncbi:MAG: ATP-binding protein [Gemmatimonadaceae bacterium]|jgi:NadR type nicotinamide-nucleotide adenylyltransferase|nr:ATP-binding protein [Gemmatimonadaceae bacterium]